MQALREALGWDVLRLAQRCALSAGQVRQLEEGGESKFYSPAIKAQAGRRALSCLEAAAGSILPAPALPPTPSAGHGPAPSSEG